MNNHSLEQLDPIASHSDAQQPKKSDNIRNILGIFLSWSKVKAKASNQSSISPAHSQKSRPPFVASHINKEHLDHDATLPSCDTDSKPSPSAAAESRRCMDIFPENVSMLVLKTELLTPQDRVERTEQPVYCNSLLIRGSLHAKADFTVE
jgi:hypothetical protein